MTRIPKDTPTEQRHVALVGFMAAGKTSVGRLVAERLGSPFVDLDVFIAERSGKSIPELFRDHGEVGFRAHERAALRELLAIDLPQVIALGGGTFVDPSMRAWVQQSARTVYLKASLDTLSTRLTQGEQKKRPMLSGPDPAIIIKRMLQDRTPAYEQADITLTTDNLAIERIAEDVISSLKSPRATSARRVARPTPAPPIESPKVEPKKSAVPTTDLTDGSALLRVQSSQGAYPVELRPQAGAWIADAILAVCSGQRFVVITDATVEKLHAAPLLESLRARGRTVALKVVSPGESSKSLQTAGAMYEALAEAGLTRKDAVIALGGGVVGDLSGFVSSTYMRGIAYCQVPTTTLAAVDASVGGKTALNTTHGKNLVGSFHPPKAVLVAGSHLSTQTPREHCAGLVEALKIATTCDAELFHEIVDAALLLSRFEPRTLLSVIAQAVSLKAEIVARDERETGDRAVLNLGHTVGHAIEAGEGYRLLHGEAVALGMIAESMWAESQSLCERGMTAKLVQGLQSLNMPTDWTTAKIDLPAMGMDKKREGAMVRLPVATKLGAFALHDVPLEALSRFVSDRSKA